MAWTSADSAATQITRAPRRFRRDGARPRNRFPDGATFLRRFNLDARGVYHRFDVISGYLLYRSNTGPPLETDLLWDNTVSLPYSPTTTFADGVWYLSVKFRNGLVDSGFLPLGPRGQTYLRLDVSGGAFVNGPPGAPHDVRLELRAGGVVRVLSFYAQFGPLRASEWAVTFTTDGSAPDEPPAVTPDVTVVMSTGGVAVLTHDLPAQADGTTVKVRVQSRRFDAAWVYSEGSTILTATADAAGPTAPLGGELWVGRMPEDL